MKGAAATGVAATGVTALGGAASAQQPVDITQITRQDGLINVVANLNVLLDDILVDVNIEDVEVNVLNINIEDNVININIDVLSNVPDGSLLTVVVEGVDGAGETVTHTATEQL